MAPGIRLERPARPEISIQGMVQSQTEVIDLDI